MRLSRKLSAALVLLVAVAVAALVAGCGGGSSSDGGGDPIALVPKDAPVYIEANLAPSSQEAEDLNGLADSVVGIDDIGKFITEELEKAAAADGEKFDYAEEVEPWLGEKAGIYLSGLTNGDFETVGAAIETTDSGEAEDFIEKRVEESDEKSEEGEFEGNKYYIESEDEETAVGTIDGFLVIAKDKALFEEMVKTSEGDEGLAESSRYKSATEAAGDTGIGRAYVDIGELLDETGSQIPPETEAFFDLSGIEPGEATAVISGIPHAGQVEIDISTNAVATSQSGDASALLESLPANSVLGLASADLGKSLGEALDKLEKEGIPGELEPGELGPALEKSGLNLDSILGSLGDFGAFVQGSNPSDIGGALVIETKDASQAGNTVSNLGLLLRSSGQPGVAPLSGDLTGFSVSTPELGAQPLIVGAAGEKLVIAYGEEAAEEAVRSQSKTLGATPDFEAAKSGLGSTPIGLFIDGAPALALAKTLLSPEEAAEFAQAEPYVEKIAYIGSGAETSGDTTNTKIIIGVQK